MVKTRATIFAMPPTEPTPTSPRVEWNKVIWYSRLLAVILFVGLVCGAFFFGSWYQRQQGSDVVPTGETPSMNPPQSKYAFPEENVTTIIATTSVPAGWVKKNYPQWNFSVIVPDGWKEADLGPMVPGVAFTSPDSTESISFAYDYPGLASTDQTIEARAKEQLFDVFPIHIAGEMGYRGVFSNATIWLASIEIYLLHKDVTYDISISNGLSPSISRILSSFAFTE
jgi:hypothetical protein